MKIRTVIGALILACGLQNNACRAGDDGLEKGQLIHWTFDEESGAIAKDSSGNGLDGTVKARRVTKGGIKALLLDGTAATTVAVDVPKDKRFGTDSWSFMAWVNPEQLTIEDRQNQRRIFAFGTYPDAYLVIDLFGTGTVGYYFCYKNPAGKIEAAGGGTSVRVRINEWTHIALACDRAAGHVAIYINGKLQGESPLPKTFAGDFSLAGKLTIGSGWHNYWGLMDEVRIYRRALTRKDVRAEFKAGRDTYGVTESAEAAAIEVREVIRDIFTAANAAWKAKNFSAVRAECSKVTAMQKAPPQHRSYAHLRIAQSCLAEKNNVKAKLEYDRIRANAEYPDVHRREAAECAHELERLAKGLAPRDPLASRVKVPEITAYALSVYVAPDGSDANDGSKEKPFATLAGARDAVRAGRAKGVDGAIGVIVKPGEYLARNTLALGAGDSGTKDSPIVYRAEKQGTATLYGGARLSDFTPVTDNAVLDRLPAESRGRVMQCDLKALGITNYGTLEVRGFGQPPSPPTLELFFDGRPMTLARWPNKGFVSIRKLVTPGDRDKGVPSVVEYEDERHARWTKAKDPWLFGYFKYLWADSTIKVAAIDPGTKMITTAEAYRYGQGPGMNARQGIIYYAFNLLEELDIPGEWYLDRASGVLYFYPPAEISKGTVELGMLEAPMLTLDGVRHVRIEGLRFDCSRSTCMRINNSENCLVAGCRVTRFAGEGIVIRGGKENGVLGCDVHTIGRRAIELIGGDRKTLTPAKHFVENCRIRSFGRIDRTYTPAVQLEGVGNRVAHNLMYDCPSSVMRIEGNDHVIEYNRVRNAVQESDDQGAMELYANPSYRGVTFRYNHFTDIGKTGTEKAVHGQAAIRFDDAISGLQVYGNIFHRAAGGHFGGVQMNSGRDNVIDNNIFADCRQAVSGGWNPGNSVWKRIRAGKKPAAIYTTDLYTARYPGIKTMMTEPGINNVWRNVFYRCGREVTGNRVNLDMLENATCADKDPGFVNAAKGDFRLKPDAPLFGTVGFRPIPVEEIGLYEDRYRKNDSKGGRSMLFMGNSITRHAPKPEIGWTGNWGMAASAEEKDYVHCIIRSLSEETGTAPRVMIENLVEFEKQYATYDAGTKLKNALAFKAATVILAIGENVPALRSETSRTQFSASVTKLLEAFKANGNPTIVVRSCFWADKAKDEILKQACQKVGGIFVDIGSLGRDASNKAPQFTHSGVAAHPGDKGMQAIADAILHAMKQEEMK